MESHLNLLLQERQELEAKRNKAEENRKRHRFQFNFIIHLDFIADTKDCKGKNKWRIYGRKIMQLILSLE